MDASPRLRARIDAFERMWWVPLGRDLIAKVEDTWCIMLTDAVQLQSDSRPMTGNSKAPVVAILRYVGNS